LPIAAGNDDGQCTPMVAPPMKAWSAGHRCEARAGDDERDKAPIACDVIAHHEGGGASEQNEREPDEEERHARGTVLYDPVVRECSTNSIRPMMSSAEARSRSMLRSSSSRRAKPSRANADRTFGSDHEKRVHGFHRIDPNVRIGVRTASPAR